MNSTPWRLRGYREAEIGVADPGPWHALLSGVGEWELLYAGDGRETGDLAEWVYGRGGEDHGAIRLVQRDPTRAANRDRAAAWDTGGLFDLDVRVRDLPAMKPLLESMGLRGISEPVDWRFGALDVREWLARGPDGVIFAFMQRLAPPLDVEPGPGFSHAFNASQTVHDLEKAIDWYRRLGFRTVVHHEAPLPGRGGEVLGLSVEQAPRQSVGLVILSPTGALEGSVELVSLPGLTGRNLSDQADPSGRGLCRLRFPVDELDAFEDHCVQQGLKPRARQNGASLPPWGTVNNLSLRSPEGAWLEFYETVPG